MFGSVRVRTPHVMSGQRVGLMGGSFAPVHEGHLAAARTAMKRLALDQIWLIVTPGNPLKDQAGLPPLDARVGRVQAMIRDRRIRVTGFESTLGNAYTAVTLGFLVRRHKGVRFVWVMGADGLALFHRWRAWRQMARLVPMAIIDRPGWRHRALASPAGRALQMRRIPEAKAARLAAARPPAWVLLTVRLSGQSSSAIRARATPGHRSLMKGNDTATWHLGTKLRRWT